MRYTIEVEKKVKQLAEEGKKVDYISSVTNVPKKIIYTWCPSLKPHEDIIKWSVKQRFRFLYPELEAKISSAFSPFVDKDISEEKWDEINKVIYDVLFEESLIVFKNALSDPPDFGEIKKLSNDKFLDFLKLFWNYEKSPYINKRNSNKIVISKTYADMCKNTIHYWSPLRNKYMKDVSVGDIEFMHEKLSAQKLSPSRIYFILKVALIPLKYAYENDLTLLKTYEYKMPKKTKKNNPLNPVLISKIFNHEWKDEEAFVANLIAYNCKMHINEIRALTLNDVYADGFIITNNIYTRYGLEKNKNKRVISIPKYLVDIILKYSSTSPYTDYKSTDYIFFTAERDRPSYATNWSEELKAVCSEFMEDSENITMSIWV